MAKHSKKPKPSIAEKKARVEGAFETLGDALDNYENEHPYWKIEVLISLIRWSLKSLKHYLEDAREKEITWESPFVELPYAVEWDWKASRKHGEKHGCILYGDITDQNVADKKNAVKTLSAIMVRMLNVTALGDLTNWVRFAKRGDKMNPYLPLEFSETFASIKSKRQRQAAFEQIIRPFSIGAALVDFETMEMREGERVSKQVAAQLATVPDSIDIPHIGFSGEVNGRKFEMSLIFQIHPLITDHGKEKAYHPITVGLFFVPEVSGNEVILENPAKWSAKDRAKFWKELFQELDALSEKLIPKKESEASVILTVNAQLKVPASHWSPESKGDTTKAIMDALSKGGELDKFNLQKEGGTKIEQSPSCPVCGYSHDYGFTRILVPDHDPITIAGVLTNIFRCVHAAHEKGFASLSTKDDELLRRCEGYGHPSKAFYDLRQSTAYKVLFDTSRRGFIALRRRS